MESLPDDVIEHIRERLDVKALNKFKSVSKQWKHTIESPSFQKRQLLRRKQSGDPHVLLVSTHDVFLHTDVEPLRTLVVGSSASVKIPNPWKKNKKFYEVCKNSCDGLICLYNRYDPSIVFNPTTRWHRTFPLCNYQLEALERMSEFPPLSPGFGKDKINGTYKTVWLYNIRDNLIMHTTRKTICEVFDFTTNAWRGVARSSREQIRYTQAPVYVDGSLHWFTRSEYKVLSLDLHTLTFKVMSNTPFLHGSHSDSSEVTMFSLDGRLCVSEQVLAEQVIWSFDSESETWMRRYSIGLRSLVLGREIHTHTTSGFGEEEVVVL
ncbi:unnamed protein product [Microthlaspi erraticum]|uniref:F-box domain-containing protein n=1 Tax=Microthlaspi erraticum TaxID=1685480 RepID=A0A6D2J954_9BRAS|nr:unnamed protein product [Microthlaspi erraticum]